MGFYFYPGTPLHFAAKRGLEQMVKLLLLNGANTLIMNADDQTTLDLARVEGHSNAVRAIENHICFFSGWMQELYGPGLLLSRNVWVVILPCGSRRLTKPYNLELAIYSGAQDAIPRTSIPLWMSNMDEPNFNRPVPVVIINSPYDDPIILAAVNENEKQQLQQFKNAYQGIPQVMHHSFPFNNQGPNVGPAAPQKWQRTLLIYLRLYLLLRQARRRKRTVTLHHVLYVRMRQLRELSSHVVTWLDACRV